MSYSLQQGAFIIAGLLFILALAGLSKHETSQRGNILGSVGMAAALVITILATVLGRDGALAVSVGAVEAPPAWMIAAILAPLALGGAFGVVKARRVEMTGMPELIALFHSFVGLAAVLVGWVAYFEGDTSKLAAGELFVGVFIGAVTFTGSIIAYLKLSAKMNSKPLMLPHHNLINLAAVGLFLVLTVVFVLVQGDHRQLGYVLLACMTLLSLALGLHLVASIGGGDMPVVVSMLNSYSGWAAAAAGFTVNNDLLIITGALV
ncbi:MAG: NAD(P)(+) transhydrogenase (Re/Si-specific) subunit beta, partial [Propionibacteriaceae bacterium]|nr:NAD(P)(+) transhydrogenase (Re/Si-specific) subunit beta [Propionibacteriaceae bacterium]